MHYSDFTKRTQAQTIWSSWAFGYGVVYATAEVTQALMTVTLIFYFKQLYIVMEFYTKFLLAIHRVLLHGFIKIKTGLLWFNISTQKHAILNNWDRTIISQHSRKFSQFPCVSEGLHLKSSWKTEPVQVFLYGSGIWRHPFRIHATEITFLRSLIGYTYLY